MFQACFVFCVLTIKSEGRQPTGVSPWPLPEDLRWPRGRWMLRVPHSGPGMGAGTYLPYSPVSADTSTPSAGRSLLQRELESNTKGLRNARASAVRRVGAPGCGCHLTEVTSSHEHSKGLGGHKIRGKNKQTNRHQTAFHLQGCKECPWRLHTKCTNDPDAAGTCGWHQPCPAVLAAPNTQGITPKCCISMQSHRNTSAQAVHVPAVSRNQDFYLSSM